MLRATIDVGLVKGEVPYRIGGYPTIGGDPCRQRCSPDGDARHTVVVPSWDHGGAIVGEVRKCLRVDGRFKELHLNQRRDMFRYGGPNSG
jgi:hypothetical protein